MSAHISGGQINCCVTAALAVVGELTWVEAGANTLAQTLGSVLGAALVDGMVPYGEESALGSNSIAHGIGIWETFLGAFSVNKTPKLKEKLNGYFDATNK